VENAYSCADDGKHSGMPWHVDTAGRRWEEEADAFSHSVMPVQCNHSSLLCVYIYSIL